MTIYERLGNILMARKLEMGLHAHTHVYGCLSKLSVLLKILNLEKTNSSRYIVQSS